MTLMTPMINTIWVVNHSGHNIESAVRDFRPKFVEYLTEGNQNLAEIDRLKYNIYQRLVSPGELGRPPFGVEDTILLCGNTVLNVIVAALLVSELKVPYMRLLIWDGKKRFYYMKDLDMGGLHKYTPDDVASLQS